MDRSNLDPFWIHVVKMDDGSRKCQFCERRFPNGTSISRIKWHLSGEKRQGVAICTGQVPKDVQEAAFLAMRGGNKRQKTIAISSNVNDNAISSCPQVENNEVDDLARDAGGIQMAVVQDTEQGAGEGRTSSPAEAGNLMEIMAGEMMQSDGGEASQAPDAGRIQMLVQGREQGVREGTTSSRAEAGNNMENVAGKMMHIDRSITWEGIIGDAHETRGEASQATDLAEMHQEVGVEFSPSTQAWLCNIFRGEMETNEEDRVSGWFTPDPLAWFMHDPLECFTDPLECGQWTEQAGQLLEKSTSMVYGVDNWAGDGGRIQMEVHCMEQGAGDALRILRISYMALNDPALQQCLLYCALFPEGFEIPREDLIGYLIDKGVIKGLKSREAEFDKGHSMLNALVNVRFLESVTKSYGDCRRVKMHDLIRDVTIQIQQENFGVMVKAGAQLKELPDVEEWAENFVRVPLMKNQNEEIPSIYSPRPKSHTEGTGDDKIEEISLGKLVLQGQTQKIEEKSAEVLQTSPIPQTLLKQQETNEIPPARVFSEEDANFEAALAASMQGHLFSSFKVKDQGAQPSLKHSSSTVGRGKRKLYTEDVYDSEDEVPLAHRCPNYKRARDISLVPATFNNAIPLQSIPAASFQPSFKKDVDPQQKYGLPLGDAFEVPSVDLLDVEDKIVQELPVVSFTPMDGGMASLRDAKSSSEEPQGDSPTTRVKDAGPINVDVAGLASGGHERIYTPLQSLPGKRDDAGVSPQEGSSSVAPESGSLEVFMRSAVPDWRSLQYVSQLLHLVNLELSHEVAGSLRVVLRSLKCPLTQLQAHLSQQQSSSLALQCSPAEMLQSMGSLSAQRLQLEKELKDLNEEAATLRERLQCIELDAKDKEAAIEQLRQYSRAEEVQMEASLSSLYEQGLTAFLNPTLDCVKRHFGL